MQIVAVYFTLIINGIDAWVIWNRICILIECVLVTLIVNLLNLHINVSVTLIQMIYNYVIDSSSCEFWVKQGWCIEVSICALICKY